MAPNSLTLRTYITHPRDIQMHQTVQVALYAIIKGKDHLGQGEAGVKIRSTLTASLSYVTRDVRVTEVLWVISKQTGVLVQAEGSCSKVIPSTATI